MANEKQGEHPMMKCGHAAQGHAKDGKWACIICVGIPPGATTVDDAPPSFAGRTAICSYSHKARAPYTQVKEPVPSGPHLAFFEHKPNEPHDRYYCGCFGWD